MNAEFTEKEILGDGLDTAKATTSNYNKFSNECSHENVRNTMLDILADEHDIQDDIYHIMSARGYYPVCAADQKKIDDTKQRFSACVK